MIIVESFKYFLYGIGVVVPIVITFCDVVGFPSTITGRSMRPTFNPEGQTKDDHVWFSTWNVHRYKPKPGDIVGLYSPIDPTKRMIKRVIAIEGELINTKRYQLKTVKIPPGHCWVEGDNTAASQDSNTYGPISTGLICGRVRYILWPPRRIGFVPQTLKSYQQERQITKLPIDL